MTDNPELLLDCDQHRPASRGVSVRHLRPDLVWELHEYLRSGSVPQSVLRVRVVETATTPDEEPPDVAGRCQVLESGIQFIPYFPFEPGVRYLATFDPRALSGAVASEPLVLEFSLPKKPVITPADVTHIYPSGELLPENLLRFYACFSNPMQRGCAETEISLLGPDSEPVPDALYRAPVELWDRSMRCLTILLDPGRLKRGLGPNRELGPPLQRGQTYTLTVGGGMIDIFGSPLSAAACKRFRVIDTVRQPIAIGEWKVISPDIDSRRPLALIFPVPLDWALLSHAIAVVSPNGQTVGGRVAIDQREQRWSFTPASRWAADSYEIRVGSELEDVCGNTVLAAFDRALRPGIDLPYEVGNRSIPFSPVPGAGGVDIDPIHLD